MNQIMAAWLLVFASLGFTALGSAIGLLTGVYFADYTVAAPCFLLIVYALKHTDREIGDS